MNLTPPLDPAALEQLFGLYRLPRMLFAVARIGLADHLAQGPRSVADLAVLTNSHESTLGSLLDALHNWGVFQREADGRFGLTAFSRRMVAGEEGGANLAMLLGWSGLPAVYDAYGNLSHTLRTGESAFRALHGADFYEYLAEHPADAVLYERAMESTTDIFGTVAGAYDFSRFETIVDVGGGQGAYALAILERYPSTSVDCLDLPQVVARAPSHPFGNRLRFVGGDIFVDLEPNADAYLTSTVLRCFDDERSLALLRGIRQAMTSHSVFLALEMVKPESRDHLLMSMADITARLLYGGRGRTEAEFADLFSRAGLRWVRSISVSGTVQPLEAVPSDITR